MLRDDIIRVLTRLCSLGSNPQRWVAGGAPQTLRKGVDLSSFTYKTTLLKFVWFQLGSEGEDYCMWSCCYSATQTHTDTHSLKSITFSLMTWVYWVAINTTYLHFYSSSSFSHHNSLYNAWPVRASESFNRTHDISTDTRSLPEPLNISVYPPLRSNSTVNHKCIR